MNLRTFGISLVITCCCIILASPWHSTKASPRSRLAKKIFSLDLKFENPEMTKKLILENRKTILKHLSKIHAGRLAIVKSSCSNQPLYCTKVVEQKVKFSKVDFLFEHMKVEKHSYRKVSLPTEKLSFWVRTPIVLQGSECLLDKQGRVVISIAPSFITLAPNKNPRGTTLNSDYTTHLQEIYARSYWFWVDTEGVFYIVP